MLSKFDALSSLFICYCSYGALKNIFLNWGETIYGLVERTWETTAAEVKKWKKDPTKKKALEIAKRDPLLKNAVFRAVLRPA